MMIFFQDGALSGTNSMESLNPLYQRNMGQRTGLSFKDAQLVNKMYCSGECSSLPFHPTSPRNKFVMCV